MTSPHRADDTPAPMSTEEMIELCRKHTVYAWSATDTSAPTPVARAEGVYFYTPEGKRFLDFSSQLVSVLVGHQHPRVIAAMKRQLDELGYVHPQTATQVRARVGRLLAQLVPGNINSFFFTLGGAEANENAVRAARLYTGKFKILSRYRSYHGATNLTLQMTGEPRRWPSEPGAPGMIRVMDPTPMDFSWGRTEAEGLANHLKYMEELIQCEGPQSIAAMICETIPGTNGVLIPPAGYFPALKQLLEKYKILLICDEVMAGMGRTGKIGAYDHFGITPDMVTFSKGLTSSYFPVGALGLSDPIADHFRKNTFWGGLTWNSHPLGLATIEAVLNVMVDEGMLENATRMGAVMRAEMDKLQARHRSVAEGRCLGLFGMIDLRKNAAGEPLAPFNGTHPAMQQLGAFLKENGLFTMLRRASVMTSPPLSITEDELKEGFAIIDRGLEITDAVYEG